MNHNHLGQHGEVANKLIPYHGPTPDTTWTIGELAMAVAVAIPVSLLIGCLALLALPFLLAWAIWDTLR